MPDYPGRSIFSNKSAIIFDFDGTIADTFRLHEKAFQETLKPYSLQFEYGNYTGRSTGEAIRSIFQNNQSAVSEEELAVLVKTKRKLANELYTAEIRFIANAFSFIQLAYSKGLRLFVGSSGSRMNIGTGIKVLGLEKYFTDVVTADDVTHAKPHPEIFETVLNRHGINAAEALVIEDAISGIRASEAAGIDVVCVDKEVEVNGCNVSFCYADFTELTQQLIYEHGE
jgi:beta-phosphoglucomutase